MPGDAYCKDRECEVLEHEIEEWESKEYLVGDEEVGEGEGLVVMGGFLLVMIQEMDRG
jgi:hypothetical protein